MRGAIFHDLFAFIGLLTSLQQFLPLPTPKQGI